MIRSNFKWPIRWCVFNKKNIFYCIDFNTKKEALDFIKNRHPDDKDFYVSKGYVCLL